MLSALFFIRCRLAGLYLINKLATAKREMEPLLITLFCFLFDFCAQAWFSNWLFHLLLVHCIRFVVFTDEWHGHAWSNLMAMIALLGVQGVFLYSAYATRLLFILPLLVVIRRAAQVFHYRLFLLTSISTIIVLLVELVVFKRLVLHVWPDSFTLAMVLIYNVGAVVVGDAFGLLVFRLKKA